MKYLIQENFFRFENMENLLKVLDATEKVYETIPVYYNREIETSFQKDEKVFIFGGLNLAQKCKSFNWFPGSLMDDNHDFEFYKHIYKDNLLNYNSKIVDLFEKFEWNEKELFIRPCKDSKIFNAKVFTEIEWLELVENLSTKKHIDKSVLNLIQISSIKKLQNEIRFWIVGDEIVDACIYRESGLPNFSRNVVKSAYEFVQQMLNFKRISSSFVMDICLTDNGYKIVEINCINASSFYFCDIFKLIEAFEKYYL